MTMLLLKLTWYHSQNFFLRHQLISVTDALHKLSRFDYCRQTLAQCHLELSLERVAAIVKYAALKRT